MFPPIASEFLLKSLNSNRVPKKIKKKREGRKKEKQSERYYATIAYYWQATVQYAFPLHYFTVAQLEVYGIWRALCRTKFRKTLATELHGCIFRSLDISGMKGSEIAQLV